ncbi:uncharacterized protein F5147DRAFT_653338 [Suillus discolor]|uniref:Uncharacterized protein n=1 Tax=Suillus discolor TaxID=1912936 RepID=A0A9P7F778_9AGAM|nr:uncharacterized protein F5147DRAFT_653338 [Suillus discolor]KAG2107480.1 hypothetical protein F5147DRAFT_653338 [Suillus discolor]
MSGKRGGQPDALAYALDQKGCTPSQYIEAQVKNLLRQVDSPFTNDSNFAYICWNTIQKKAITRKRKKVSPRQSEVHGEEMDVDIPDTLSSSIIAPPLFSAQLSPIVPEIGNSHTVEDENGDADIVAASEGKKRDTKLSSRAKGKKKGWKQADRVEPDDLAHKSPTDFVEEEEPKLTSKKALSKPTSAATSKSKSKAKGKRFSRKVDTRTTTATLLIRGPLTKATIFPRTKTRDDGPKNSESIVIPEITKKIPPKSVAAPPKQTPSVTIQSCAFSIKPKSTPVRDIQDIGCNTVNVKIYSK